MFPVTVVADPWILICVLLPVAVKAIETCCQAEDPLKAALAKTTLVSTSLAVTLIELPLPSSC